MSIHNPISDNKPFIIRAFPEHMAHLCPVRAVSQWVSAAKLKTGFLFPKLNKNREPITLKQSPMVR